MSFIIAALQTVLPEATIINSIHATFLISCTIALIYNLLQANFILPARRAKALRVVRCAMSSTIRAELAFERAREKVRRTMDTVRRLEEGQIIFGMSDGAKVLRGSTIQVEEAQNELQKLCGELKALMARETEAVEMLARVG